MALNEKGGFDLNGRLNRNKSGNQTDNAATPTPTVTYTHEYAPAHTPTRNRERKTERLQLVVRPSTKARLARYAEDHNTSSNEVVQKLLDELLDSEGY